MGEGQLREYQWHEIGELMIFISSLIWLDIYLTGMFVLEWGLAPARYCRPPPLLSDVARASRGAGGGRMGIVGVGGGKARGHWVLLLGYGRRGFRRSDVYCLDKFGVYEYFSN